MTINSHFLKLIDTLSLPLKERAARSALRYFALELGYEFYAYLYLCGPESFAISNYPPDWQRHYIEKDYLLVDPVVTEAKHGSAIFAWSTGVDRHKGRKDVRQFYADATEFGICSGLSIAVPVGFKNRMVFTLATGKFDQTNLEAIDPVTAAVAVAFIHSRFAKDDKDVALASDILLSPREAECLRWFAEGMPVLDIAEVLGISFRSVRSYLDSATTKLGAGSNRQAGTIATRLRLI